MSDATKRKIRNGHRIHVRKTISKAKEIIEVYDASHEHVLRSYLEILVEKQDFLKTIDEEIVVLSKEEDIEKEVHESGEFRRVMKECASHIKAVLNPPESTSGSSVSSPKEEKVFHNQVRLPKLHLKKFNGDPVNWQYFWDSFESAVHKNDGINSIDKFNYLLGLVDGDAARAISGLTLSGENYKSAIEILEERYGNKQLIVSRHMDKLLKITPIVSSWDVKGMRNVCDTIEANVRSLEALGISPEQYGSLLAPIFMSKIPDDLRLVICRNATAEIWDLKGLLQTFKKELQARERCAFVTEPTKEKRETKKPPLSEYPFTSSSLTTSGASASGRYNNISCTYCSQQHPSARCNIVSELASRKANLRQRGRCFLCLKSNHISRNCTEGKACFKCGGRHHVSICNKMLPSSQSSTIPGAREPSLPSTTTREKTPSFPSTSTTHIASPVSTTSVLLQTATTVITAVNDPDNGVRARILFDLGSQRSFVSYRLCEALKLPRLRSDMLMIKTFGNATEQLQECPFVQMCIQAPENKGNFYLSAHAVPTICASLNGQVIDIACEKYPHLQGLTLADNAENQDELDVDVLIGSDYYWNFFTRTVRRGGADSPVAVYTRLGWVLSGPVMVQQDQSNAINLSTTHVLRIETRVQEMPSNLHDQLKDFWELESISIKPEEESVYDKFLKETEFNGERYEVKLPWKEDHRMLPDNRKLSSYRLKSLLNRLKLNPGILKEYDNVIQEQYKLGIIEDITESTPKAAGMVHYLPHRAVVRQDKSTTKLRVVYDASARSNGPSLNDCLHCGPSLMPLLFDILLRFRVNKVALVADIEKAFLNISIAEADRDYLRFLWVNNIDSEKPDITVYRFARVVFGVTCSPFLLNATLQHHISSHNLVEPEFAERMLRSLYVDDFASGAGTLSQGLELYSKCKSLMREGGFNMRKWLTNSPELSSMINEKENCNKMSDNLPSVMEEDESYVKTTFGSSSEVTKVMGMSWNNSNDTIIFNFQQILPQLPSVQPTKRSVLSATARIFDPMGLISPILILMKTLFQELCKTSCEWDAMLQGEVKSRWEKWITDIQSVKPIAVPRCFFDKSHELTSKVELHGFSDSSTTAYAAAVYIRVVTTTQSHCKLVASKTRVAPMKEQTIPRLELLGALILARLITSVCNALSKEIDTSSVICWVDSQVALCWINGVEKEYKQFVQHRVNKIRKLIPPECWRYCPGPLNPADIPSRGMMPTELANCKQWWNGPDFLTKEESLWPNTSSSSKPLEDALGEEKARPCKKPISPREATILQTAVNAVKNVAEANLEIVIPSTRYSSLERLFRVTSLVRRFIANARRKVQHRDLNMEILSTEELAQSKEIWIKHVQKNILNSDKFKQMQVSLDLFTDEKGLLRCGGRISQAAVPYSTKHPLLLLRDHHLTDLIILNCHWRVHHNGLRETLTELRVQFWISKGRQYVKKIIKKCVTCRRHEGQGYQVPPQPALPECRVCDDFAFTRIGVDFAGPVYVRSIYREDKRMHKAYICLITCAVSRGVHLDLVPNLTTEAFVRCLRRFVSRKGVPSLVISDNGKTFKSAHLTSFLTSSWIQWQYNVEKAPWWGGFFERMVKSVKRCLKKTLGNARLTYEELLTILIEVEGVLNSRPLTYVYENDFGNECLTPSHLFMGRRVLSQGSDAGISKSLDTEFTAANHLGLVLQHFWSRWSKEYLTELREHHRVTERRRSKSAQIQEGDVVCVHEEKLPRNLWRLGRIQKLIQGQDGHARAAVVKVFGEGKQATTIQRPVQRLYPVELSDRKDNPDDDEDPPRPRRRAAVDADLNRRLTAQR